MSANSMAFTALQRGDGKGRDPWMLRRWLAGSDLRNMVGVATLAQVHHNIVSDTLRGLRNHGRVLQVLADAGCPEDLLYPQRNARRAQRRAA